MLPLEAAGIPAVDFLLTVEGDDFSSPKTAQVSVALKCQLTWFFSAEPQAGICPTEPIWSYAAAQRFERGTMIWLEQLGRYFILDEAPVEPGSDRKQLHNVYDPLEIMNDSSADIDPPQGLFAPQSGFGLVWRGDVDSSPGFRQSLGWALAPEFGYEAVFQCDDALPSGGRSWQSCFLRGPGGEILALHPLGGWVISEGNG
jgi:hypothetical protein